jgi:hypothetical protein
MEKTRREREEVAEAKTSKNRAKRQKRNEAARKGKEKGHNQKNATGKADGEEDDSSDGDSRPTENQPFKKRRLVAQPTAGWDKEDAMDAETNINTNPTTASGNATSIADALSQNPDIIVQGQAEDASQAVNVIIHDED